MAVANGEHARRITTARIVGTERLVNVLLRQIEPPLFDLNRSVRQLRVGPQQPAKVGTADAQFGRRLADIVDPFARFARGENVSNTGGIGGAPEGMKLGTPMLLFCRLILEPESMDGGEDAASPNT